MKYFLILLSIGLLMSCTTSDSQEDQLGSDSVETLDGFNPQLAEKLGADEYGMHKYVMAFLKAGPNRNLPAEEATELQKAHLANIAKMAKEGKLVVAGPFLDDGEIRGIYIFDVDSIEEAEELTNSDPAIQAGSLVMELKPWYGSAALLKVNEIHNKIAKENP